MPIYRIFTGFKNPPVFALDGRGPPVAEKKDFFFGDVALRSFYIVCFKWKDNKARNILIYGIILYAAEVQRKRTYS